MHWSTVLKKLSIVETLEKNVDFTELLKLKLRFMTTSDELWNQLEAFNQ